MAEGKVGDGYIEIGADDSEVADDVEAIKKMVIRVLRDAAEDAGDAMRRALEVPLERIREDLRDLGRDLNPVIEPDLDDALVKKKLTVLARDRIVNLFVRLRSNVAAELTKIVSGLSGATMLENWAKSFSNLLQNMPQITLKFAAFGAVISSIVSPIGALLGVMAPLGRSLGQLLPLALAAPAAFGAMIGVTTVLTMAFKDLKDSTSKAGQEFYKFTQTLNSGLKEVVQQSFFSEFNRPFRQFVKQILPQVRVGLAGLARQLGTVLGGMLTQLRKSLGGGELTKFLNLFSQGLKNATPGITAVVAGLTKIALAGAELFPKMGTWISEVTSGFERWAESTDIAGLISNAATQFGNLVGVAKELMGIVGGLFRAMETGKSTGLESMRETLAKVHEIIDSPALQTGLQTVFIGMSEGAGKLRAALGPIGESLGKLAPLFADLFSTLAGVGADALKGILEGLSQPAAQDGIHAALAAVADVAKQIDWNTLGQAVGALGKAIAASMPVVVGLVNTVAPMLPGILDFVTKLLEGFQKIPTPITLALIGVAKLGPAISGLVFSKGFMSGLSQLLTSSGKLPGLAANLAGVAQKGGGFSGVLMQAFSKLIPWLTTVIPAAFSTLSTAIMAIPVWGWIIAAVAVVVGALVWFFTQTEVGKKMWSDFLTWLGQAWQSISKTATDVWNGIVDFFTGLWEGIINAPQAVVDWFNNTFLPFFQSLPGLAWQGFLDLITWFASLPGTIMGFLLTGFANMITFWTNMITGVIGAVSNGIAAVIDFFVKLPGRIISAIVWLATEVPAFFQRMWTAAVGMVVAGISAVVGFFTELPVKVIAAVIGLVAAVSGWMSDVWRTVTSAVVNGILAVVKLFKELPGKIIAAISSLGSQLFGAVTKGMSEGNKAALKGVGDVVKSVAEIPGKVLKALGNLGNVLFKAGAQMMQGFLDGLTSIWDNIQNFVGNIANWIRNHKGPLTYDYRLLQPAAKMIMGGFYDQLRAGMEVVKGLVTDFGPSLQANVTATTRGPQYAAGTAGSSSNVVSYDFSGMSLDAENEEEQDIIDAFVGMAKRKARAKLGVAV